MVILFNYSFISLKKEIHLMSDLAFLKSLFFLCSHMSTTKLLGRSQDN